MLEGIRELQSGTEALYSLFSKLKTVQVRQKIPRESAQAIVDIYFRNIRSTIKTTNYEFEQIPKLDEQMHLLLEATHKQSTLSKYKSIIGQIKQTLIELEKIALLETSNIINTQIIDKRDKLIITTLQKVCPSAALSYEQALIDMSSNDRLSWRGPATDYREALRECLDVLAPDSSVEQMEGFKLEKDVTKPTMKQKVKFILKKREQTQNAIKPVQDSVKIIEDSLSSFVRSVYTRANISTHTPTNKAEVIRVRDQVRIVLSEILEIT